LVLVAAGAAAVWIGLRSGYDRAFKEQLIQPLVRFLAPSMTYLPQNGISEARFCAGELFRQRIDRYRSEDLVKGTVGETRVEFADVRAEHKVETRDSRGQRHTRWQTVFHGLFFIADFHKHFQGRTLVLPDTAQKLFGKLGQALQRFDIGRGELIQLEDPDFEEEFVVYGTDQVEARYILSPALMQRMLALRRQTGAELFFSFTNGEMHLAIADGKDRFRPSLFRSVLDRDTLRTFADELLFALDLVETLNLNTRIWTKE
jgi:DNA-binding transcriptional LysR family regulator